MTTTSLRARASRDLSVLLRVTCIAALLAAAFAHAAAPDPARADEAEFQEALNRINTYRAWIGIEPLRMDPALMNAAQAHADYWEVNGDSMAGMGLHYQTPGNPRFTGETMSDRASHFGYEGSINENVGLSGSMVATVDWSIATISHRQTLLDPRYTDVGFGAVKSGSGGMETIILGGKNWSNTAEPAWQAWPVDGTSGIGLDMMGSIPGPLAGASGYPITLKYHGGGSVEFHSAELSTGGESVPINYGVGNGWLSRRTMMIMSIDSLQPHTAYTVSVDATVDGQPVTRSWSFQTGESNAALPSRDHQIEQVEPAPEPEPPVVPDRVAALDDAMQEIWTSADAAVYSDEVDRSWLWGPDVFTTTGEPYAESPGGERQVAYFDKTRMEINNPDGDRSSDWFVTNGLLVREMISGELQVGQNQFSPHGPAEMPIAGDSVGSDVLAPGYAALLEHSAVVPENQQPDRTGEAVKTWITQDGTKYHGEEAPDGVHYGHYDDVTGFNVADIFWDWISDNGYYDWLYAVGRPITDPHWIWAPVGGEEQWVLMQAFERRILTYTPGNEPGWELEMGNVGRHYYSWRYNEQPPE